MNLSLSKADPSFNLEKELCVNAPEFSCVTVWTCKPVDEQNWFILQTTYLSLLTVADVQLCFSNTHQRPGFQSQSGKWLDILLRVNHFIFVNISFLSYKCG